MHTLGRSSEVLGEGEGARFWKERGSVRVAKKKKKKRIKKREPFTNMISTVEFCPLSMFFYSFC